MLLKVLWTEKPGKLHESVFSKEAGKMIRMTKTELERIPKLCRKSWRIGVIRYEDLLPEEFFQQNPNSPSLKCSLRLWVRNNIPPDGDYIFKGKVKKKDIEDWLTLELEKWKKRNEEEQQCYEEWKEVEEYWEMNTP